jgi:hypothetical protein
MNGPPRSARPSPPHQPHPFSLADPTVTEGILAAAGFAEVSFTDVHEPGYYGPDSATAFPDHRTQSVPNSQPAQCMAAPTDGTTARSSA